MAGSVQNAEPTLFQATRSRLGTARTAAPVPAIALGRSAAVHDELRETRHRFPHNDEACNDAAGPHNGWHSESLAIATESTPMTSARLFRFQAQPIAGNNLEIIQAPKGCDDATLRDMLLSHAAAVSAVSGEAQPPSLEITCDDASALTEHAFAALHKVELEHLVKRVTAVRLYEYAAVTPYGLRHMSEYFTNLWAIELPNATHLDREHVEILAHNHGLVDVAIPDACQAYECAWSLARLPSLTRLDISWVALSEEAVRKLLDNRSLRFLALCSFEISDSVQSELEYQYPQCEIEWHRV